MQNWNSKRPIKKLTDLLELATKHLETRPLSRPSQSETERPNVSSNPGTSRAMEQSEEDQHVQIISPFKRAHEEEKKKEEKNLQETQKWRG